MAISVVLLLLVACGAYAQPPQHPGPPGRRPGPHSSVSVSDTQAYAGTPDRAPERLGDASRPEPARPLQPEPAQAARPPVPQPPRRTPSSPRYDPIFNPIIAISTPVSANDSASMGGAGAWPGAANPMSTPGGVQTVSANSAQSLQAAVANNMLPGMTGQPAAGSGGGGRTVTVTNGDPTPVLGQAGGASVAPGVVPSVVPGVGAVAGAQGLTPAAASPAALGQVPSAGAGGTLGGMPANVVASSALPPQVASVFSSAERNKNLPLVSAANGGFSIQQPIVSNPDGITSGGNILKAGQQGVTLGNVGVGDSIQFAQGGGVTIDPGSAGSLWNLARQAAALYGKYGRKLKL